MAKWNEWISLPGLNQSLYLFPGTFSKMIQISLVSFWFKLVIPTVNRKCVLQARNG